MLFSRQNSVLSSVRDRTHRIGNSKFEEFLMLRNYVISVFEGHQSDSIREFRQLIKFDMIEVVKSSTIEAE